MKIDRLLGIVMYLLNRDLVSARVLAEKFEVSVRTIQRDIDSLTMAGIPIVSIQGSTGGYGIMQNFKLDKQIMDIDDYCFIITALRSLCSAYENKKLEETLEKIHSLLPGERSDKPNTHLFIDFGVSREGAQIDPYISLIESAIDSRKVVEFEYTSGNHQKTSRAVEPLALIFQWYAWYFFAFCLDRNDYRLFRLSRVRNLSLTERDFSREHKNTNELWEEYQIDDPRPNIRFKLLCKDEVKVSIEDYFANGTITSKDDGTFVLEMCLPEDEQFWLGMLLSYGDKVKVLEPPRLREMLLKKVGEVERLYGVGRE